MAGITSSTDFPTTPGAFQTTFGGGSSDAFVTKLNPLGTGLVYSTYLGGSGDDAGLGIAIDALPTPNAYVTGQTSSTNFPTVNPIQAAFGGGSFDAFVTKLNPFGNDLVYSTYLGGSGSDGGASIALDTLPNPNAYVAGIAGTNFPTTAGAFQTGFGGGSGDAFVAKISSFVAFSAFSAQLEIQSGPPPGFETQGSFTLEAGSSGINPPTQNVTLQIGSFSITIPAGSFVQDSEGNFEFEGTISGVTLDAEIAPLGSNSFSFSIEGEGVDLTGLTNPVTVVLTIGNNSGTTTVTAEFD